MASQKKSNKPTKFEENIKKSLERTHKRRCKFNY